MTSDNKILTVFREYPYTILLTTVFCVIGFGLTYYIGYTWIQPENEKEIKKYCPNGLDKCGLIIDQNPIFVFVPLGMLVLGMSLGVKLDTRSSTKSQEGKEV